MRLLIGLGALAALALLAAAALQRGAADLAAFGARHGLDRGFASVAAGQRARDGLEQAIRLDSGNADHRAYLARWHETAAQYGEALKHYRASAEARPSWPYAWADIARAKVALGEFDNELDAAVGKAARLGPWEPGVQVALAEVVMAAGNRLSPASRDAALQAMGNALKRHERELVSLAVRRGRLDVLCSVPGIGRYPAALRCI